MADLKDLVFVKKLSDRAVSYTHLEKLVNPFMCKEKHKSIPDNSLKLSIHERGMYEYRGGCSNEVI